MGRNCPILMLGVWDALLFGVGGHVGGVCLPGETAALHRSWWSGGCPPGK